MVAITERPKVVPAIIEWPVVDTDWMDEGWDEPVGPPNPKLSDLILLGGVERRQRRGMLVDLEGGVCAVGAAYVGAFGKEPLGLNTRDASRQLEGAFGIPMERKGYGDGGVYSLRDAVVHLNDSMSQKFLTIVEWLRAKGL